MNQTKRDRFINILADSVAAKNLRHLTLLNKRDRTQELKKTIVRLVQLKAGERLSFTYRYPTNDITKNYPLTAALEIIGDLLEKNFTQAELATTESEWYLSYPDRGKTKLTEKSAIAPGTVNLSHDHKKKRAISEYSSYLTHLGVSNDNGKILKDKQAKYRQINKVIEIIDPIISKSALDNEYTVADMGSGKGYLTFALYDHLKNNLNHNPTVTGIEIRPDLVKKCNSIAEAVAYEQLHFTEGSIDSTAIENIDILIALHACNTATDDAIYKGIKAEAKIIICSPCCHKQIRKQMETTGALKNITQYGILKERQAELITDTIRALILKAHGYQTNVMEFISTEHTPKNLLIVGTRKTALTSPDSSIMQEIQEIKKLYGIKEHYLERLVRG